MRALALALLISCAGDKGTADDGPAPDGDADTDADADADTDADADLDTAVDTATTDSAPVLGTGPIAPAWYNVASVYVYDTGASYYNGRDSGIDTGGGGGGGPAPGEFPVRYVLFDMQFGFDGTSLTSVWYDGAEIVPTIAIYLGTERWADGGFDFADTANYCSVVWPMTGAGAAGWVAGIGRLWWGADYPGGSPLEGTCNTPGYRLDVDVWGDPQVDWASFPVGGAVGDMTPEVQDLIAPYVGPDIAYFFGGQMRLDFLFGEPIDAVYALAYEVDPATMDLRVDASGSVIPILAQDLYPWP